MSRLLRAGLRVGLVALAAAIAISVGSRHPAAAGCARYVATAGSDANDGSEGYPWRSIQHAIDVAEPGDTIYVMAGVYDESLRFSRSGTATAPITIRAYDGHAVTVHGGGSPAILDKSGTEYWHIHGLTLDSDAEQTVLLDAWGCGGTCLGSHHWTFSHNTVIGAIKLYGSYNVVENNTIDGTWHKGEENGLQDLYDASHHNTFSDNHVFGFTLRGIWSRHRSHDNVISGNTIHDIGWGETGMGIDLDGFGSVVWRHTVSGNTVYNCNQGIVLENAFDCVAEGNVVHDLSEVGISVINYGATIPSPGTAKCEVGGEENQYGDTDGDNDCEGDLTGNILRQNVVYGGSWYGGVAIRHAGGVTIVANTLYDSGQPAVLLDSGAEYCPETVVRGNILSYSREAHVSLVDLDSLIINDHNLFFHVESGGVYVIRDAWRHLSVQAYGELTPLGEGSIEADPLFVDRSHYNLRLRAGSPAIDIGVDPGTSADADGTPRPQGRGYDMGAYEYIPTPYEVCVPMVGMVGFGVSVCK